MFHYNLDRFSEDIDLDSTDESSIKKIVDDFCTQRGFTYNHKKDTGVTQRFMIVYDDPWKPLKVEVSYRERNIPPSKYRFDKGVAVYTIDALANKKAGAYQGRDRLRDLFDVSFLINNYFSELSDDTIDRLIEAFQHKGLEHCDYIIDQQKDPLIDPDKLSEAFLDAYDKIGLLKFDDYQKEKPSTP